MRTSFSIALTLLWAATASAQTDPVTSLVEAGRAEIAQGAYESGVGKLIEAHKIARTPEILFDLAVAYSQWQGHCQDAITTFDRFFEACQKCSSFAAAKERNDRVRAACQVKVKIETTPPGAMISIDEAPIGTSPLEATIIAGTHTFEAELSGYDTPLTTQGLAAGQTGATIKLDLKPLPAFIQLQNIAPDSTVTVSGVPAKQPKIEVQPGRHKIEASRPGHESKTIEVMARRGETVQVDVALAPEKTSYRTFMWAGVGIGAFALVSAGAFGLMAKDAASDRKQIEMMTGNTDEVLRDLENREKSRIRLAAILGGVAVAGGIAALVFYLIEPEENDTAPVAIGVGPEGVLVSGTF